MADIDDACDSHVDAMRKGPKPPLDLSYHFSRVTAARTESSIKRFYKYFQIPGIGNLAGGESFLAYVSMYAFGSRHSVAPDGR